MDNLLIKLKKAKKRLGIVFIILFSISALFPIAASVGNKSRSVTTAGYFDVAIAFFCFMTFVLLSLNNGKQKEPVIRIKAQKITEYISTLPLILISLYLINVKLNWDILLIGLGWRFWLLIMALPYLISAFQKDNEDFS